MQHYILRRLLVAIPVLVIVSLVVFALLRVMPGDPAMLYLAEGPGVSPEVYQAMLQKLGLDRPLHVQYFMWLKELFQSGGVTKMGGLTFTEELRNRLPVTLELAGLSILIAWLIGIPGGIIAAVRQDTPADYAFRVTSITLYAVPHFWLAVLFILVPLHLFNWTPNSSYISFWKDPVANMQQYLFPAFIMGVTMGAFLLRMTRSSLLEVMRADYVRTASAKGLRERTVLTRHALRNAMIPVLTVFGTQFGAILGGSVIMEQIYQLPGLGRLMIDSLTRREYVFIQSLVLVYAVLHVTVNLAVDVAYAFVDPRIRLR